MVTFPDFPGRPVDGTTGAWPQAVGSGGHGRSPGVLLYGSETAAAIRWFRPVEWSQAWVVNADLVRSIAVAAGPEDPRRAREVMRLLARVVVFAHRPGVRLTAGVLLAPETVDRFCAHGCGRLKDSTRAGFRRELGRLGRLTAAGPGGGFLAESPWRPYSAEELAALWWWAVGQRIDHLRDGCLSLLCLGYGCGLPPAQIVAIRTDDIVEANGGLLIRREDRAPVACPLAWRATLGRLVSGLGGHQHVFWPGRAARETRLAAELIRRADRADAPRLRTSRLHATWFTDQLLAGVPITVLAAQAGSGEMIARTLGRVLPFLPEPAEAQAERLLVEPTAPGPPADPEARPEH